MPQKRFCQERTNPHEQRHFLRPGRHPHRLRSCSGVCGASLDEDRETKEDVITYLLSQIASPDQVVMVGDTDYDVIGARAHGIDTIGVTWGYGQAEAMVAAGAVALADSPQALHRLLSRRQ